VLEPVGVGLGNGKVRQGGLHLGAVGSGSWN
jgi:hypothetical protein